MSISTISCTFWVFIRYALGKWLLSFDEKDVVRRHGFTVTRPLRAITDLAAAESVSLDIIEQALKEGRQRGLITAREISELREQRQIPKWFDELLVEGKP